MKPVDKTAAGPAPETHPGKLDPAKKQKLQKAAKEFEAMFVAYMLKTMRQSVPESDMFGDNFGGDMLTGMFDLEIANHVSRSGSLGIARTMYRKLTGEDLEAHPAPVNSVHPQVRRQTPQPVPAKTIQENRAPAPAPSAPPDTPVPVQKKTVFQPSKSLTERLGTYQAIIDTAAARNGVDSTLVKAVIAGESSARPDAQSSKSAKGLMQLIDSTAAGLGVKNVWDPEENIEAGVKYLKQLLDRFDGDVNLALASYNAGPGAVEKHGGIPPFKETREYVNRVKRYLNYFQLQEPVSNEE